jgi:cytochrome c-type biogenesis protein CcmH
MAGLALSGRLNGPALQIAGAALLLALAGYGWQGSPGMAGTPVHHISR